jgi:putative membrane protein
MHLILQLLLNAGVLLLLSYLIPEIKVRSYATAVGVALVVGIFNATIGFLLRLADKFFKGFEVRTFMAALMAAIGMAIAGTLLSYIFHFD